LGAYLLVDRTRSPCRFVHRPVHGQASEEDQFFFTRTLRY
jgi:hypothetical protein